jgi:hypothetical protein
MTSLNLRSPVAVASSAAGTTDAAFLLSEMPRPQVARFPLSSGTPSVAHRVIGGLREARPGIGRHRRLPRRRRDRLDESFSGHDHHHGTVEEGRRSARETSYSKVEHGRAGEGDCLLGSGQRHGKGRALTNDALHRDFAAHCPHQLAADGESQPHSLLLFGVDLLVHLDEWLEDLR